MRPLSEVNPTFDVWADDIIANGAGVRPSRLGTMQ
jgi:hypothetical protein